MAQTLQQSLLSCKSMNGIIEFNDGAGSVISNGRVVTGNVNTNSLTTNTLVASDLSLNNLTVSVSAEVPDVTLFDYSKLAVNTRYLTDYVTAIIPIEPYLPWSLTLATSTVNGNYYHNQINSNLVTIIRLPNETTFTNSGFKYLIYPGLAWASLASSITVQTITGSTILYNNQVVSTVTMGANNPILEFTCINITGTGLCWAVTTRDPRVLLDATNVWSGSNTFSNLTFSNISSNIAITNADFTSPSFPNSTTTLWTTNTTGSTYTAMSGWTFLLNNNIDTNNFFLQIVNNNQTYFYNNTWPNATKTNIVMRFFNQSTLNRCTMTSQNYSLTAGEYEVSFFLQTNSDQVNVSANFRVLQGATTIGSVLGVSPAGSYPTWIQYSCSFSLSSTQTINFALDMTGGYLSITSFTLRLTNAMLFTDGATLTHIGAKQSILNDVYVNDGVVVNSGGLRAIGGLFSGTTFGSSNTALNSQMGRVSTNTNSSCIAIGIGALESSNGASRCISIGNWTTFSSAPVDTIVIGFRSQANTSTTTILGNDVYCRGSMNAVVGYATSRTSQGGLLGSNNSVIGAECFQQGNGFGNFAPSQNAVVGWQSNFNSMDNFNSAVGVQSLYAMAGNNNFGGSGLITQYNSALGWRAGYNRAIYQRCTFLGSQTDCTVSGLNNVTCVGFGTTCGVSNRIQLGSNSESVAISGNLVSGANTITATQLGFLSGLASAMVDTTTNQSIGGIKTFTSLSYQAVNSEIRSNWATGGTLGLLNRNISQILTPLNYNLTTKEFQIMDEINGSYFTVDLSNSVLSCSTLISNFFYDVVIGRDLTLTIGNLVSGANTITPTQLGYLSATTSALVTTNSGTQNIAGQKTFTDSVLCSGSLTVQNGSQFYINSGSQIYWNYDTMNTQVVMYDAGNNPYFRINDTTRSTCLGKNALALDNTTTDNVAIGNNALGSHISSSGTMVAVGYNSLGSATALAGNIVAIGASCASNLTTGACSNLVMIGNGITVSNPTGAFTNSIGIGNGVQIASSNFTYIGNTSNMTVFTPGSYRRRSMVMAASNTLVTANLTLSSPYFDAYSINITGNITITLPGPTNSSTHLGNRIIFRRVAGSTTATVTSTATDVVPINSITVGTSILASGEIQVTLVNMLISTNLYYWVAV